MPLSVESEEFLSWLEVERGRAANTLAAYRRDLTGYELWLAEQGLNLGAVTEDVALGYVAHLKNAGRAPASVARALVAVRSLHRFLVDEGQAEVDPTGDVGVPKVPQGLPKSLSEAEVEGLLGAVSGGSPKALRDRAILELLYSTGMRISELCGLDLDDLFLDEGVVRVYGKGGKERLVPVGRYAREACEAWLGEEGRLERKPKRWARKGDADAVFLNTRGGRLSRQGAWAVVRLYGDRVRPRRAADAARPPPLLRHSSSRPRRRPSGGAGAPRPRVRCHDPGVHKGVDRTAPSGL